MKQVQLNVDDEIKALGDAISGLIADIKAKKDIAVIVGDALPNLMMAVSGFQAMPIDARRIDNQVYLIKSIAGPLEV